MGSWYWRSTEYSLAWFVLSELIYFFKSLCILSLFSLRLHCINFLEFLKYLHVIFSLYGLIFCHFSTWMEISGLNFSLCPINVIMILRSTRRTAYQLRISSDSLPWSQRIANKMPVGRKIPQLCLIFFLYDFPTNFHKSNSQAN